MLIAATGTIMRALPTPDGLQIKVATATGSMSLEVPAARADLIATTRAARMSGAEMAMRHTRDMTLVAICAHVDGIAA